MKGRDRMFLTANLYKNNDSIAFVKSKIDKIRHIEQFMVLYLCEKL
jgi:hypothetical protein